MCATESLAVMRAGTHVSLRPLTTEDKLEEAMGEAWPEHLDKAVQEKGWCDKNEAKKFGSQAWSVAVAKTARVELKRLWAQFKTIKWWCNNVANPIYLRFLNKDRSVPSGTTKEEVCHSGS